MAVDRRRCQYWGVAGPAKPITITIVNDYEVVVRGVAHMLADDDRLALVELDVQTDPQEPVDLVLFDTFAAMDSGQQITRLLANPRVGGVVVFSWHTDEQLVRSTLELGVRGYLSKALDATELADALVRVHAGERVVEPKLVVDIAESVRDWPGRRAGLSPREGEIVALITQGATNEEIAASCYLSINSVKSYIRSAYRKMGVERRSQAVIWGIEHGMMPRSARPEVAPAPGSAQ